MHTVLALQQVGKRMVLRDVHVCDHKNNDGRHFSTLVTRYITVNPLTPEQFQLYNDRRVMSPLASTSHVESKSALSKVNFLT